MREVRIGWIRLMPVHLFILLLTGAAQASGEIAELEVSSHQLTWTPRLASDRLSLTLAGENLHIEQRHGAGEPAMLDTLAAEGTPLKDGVYTWELRVLPDITLTRADKEAGVVGSWPAETQNGRFVIRDGQLFNLAEEKE